MGDRVSDNGWESVRRDRLVKNELAFRDYNNRRVALEQQAVAIEPDVVDEAVPFVCECGNADCASALTVTVNEYETAHSTPNRFTVKPGHVYKDVEFVTEQHDHYWVVEKHPGEMPVD
jgi:5-bromo-4-chloroindolyl phosphate hydrolysis protein